MYCITMYLCVFLFLVLHSQFKGSSSTGDIWSAMVSITAGAKRSKPIVQPRGSESLPSPSPPRDGFA